MRKIFKKVISAVASMAMLAGMVAGVPSIEAKAATETTDIVVLLSDNTINDKEVSYLLLDINYTDNGGAQSDYSNITSTQNPTTFWGRECYKFNKVGDTYSVTVSGTMDASEWCNANILLVGADNNNIKGFKYHIHDSASTFNDNSKVYLSIDVTAAEWSGVSASATDPNAITAAQVIAKIDEIGTVEYTDASKAKLQAAQALKDAYQGADSTITNLNKLTEGWAKYNELKAAAEAAANAAAAGEVTLYVKNTQNWDDVCAYVWNGGEKYNGAWPGAILNKTTKNEGWYSGKFNIEKVSTLILNNKANGKQTQNYENLKKGTYWVVINDDLTVAVTTTAPTGWTDEAASEAATAATEATTQATTADSSFVAKDIKVKVKLDAAVTWDKVYLYSWNGGDKMSGDWPGTEATKEGDYYVITINAKTKYVNMIANNGSGEQTIDIENIDCSGDEVILNVSGEKNSDGKYVGTSPAQKTTTSGDTTPFVAIVAVLAMLGCAFVALNSKKARR